MSFRGQSDIPVITWKDLHAINMLMKSHDGKRPLQAGRAYYRKVLDRYLLSILKPSPFAVLSAITARTFGFDKPLEYIPLTVFKTGIDTIDSDGFPHFSGLKIQTSTIRTALDELAAGHFIERFQIVDAERTVHAYMPCSALVLLYMTMRHGDWDNVSESIASIAMADREPTPYEQRIIEPLRPKDTDGMVEAA